MDDHRAIWLQSGNVFLGPCPKACALISLSPHNKDLRFEVQHWKGRVPGYEHESPDDYGFSPCGKRLYLFEDLTRRDRQTPIKERLEIKSMQGGLMRPEAWFPVYKLWLGTIEPGIPECVAEAQYLTTTELDMGTIAWHPSPASRCMFAVADVLGTACLFGGSSLQIVRAWCYMALVREEIIQMSGKVRLRLEWSPGGSQLAYCINGTIALLCFGGKEYLDCDPAEHVSW
ncbi:hypothetical protein WJX84_010476 [Apatococcus fuscideae]|uniref:Uncharacterized protein n=1 Tax=Apatococcus fuscideae TaxID=2026836 RepID=A0AAW1SVR9_9CHLO